MANEDTKETKGKQTAVPAQCYLRSTTDCPVEVKVGKHSMVLSPRQRVLIKDASTLGTLPAGVTKIDIGE